VTETVPLFPLSHTVLFPGMLLPLHVFEERYRELVRTLVARDGPGRGRRRFGVVAIRQGWEVGAAGAHALHQVGCAAELRRVSRYQDGRFDIVTEGSDRFRLLDVQAGVRPYLVGTVDWLPADPAAEPEAAAEAGLLAAGVGALFDDYLADIATIQGAAVEPPELPGDPTKLSYLVAAGAVLTLEDRQALLEADSTVERLRAELRLLKRESTMLRRLQALPTSLATLQVAHSLS
jgi:Lon protease-like protein